MIGQLFTPKGWEHFLEIARILVKEKNLSDIEFNIVGDGPLLCDLKKLSIMYGLNNHIVFHGYLDDPMPILRMSDIYLSTSKREGLSVAILEALVQSLPIVASNVGCTCDQVIPFFNGFLFKSRAFKCSFISRVANKRS